MSKQQKQRSPKVRKIEVTCVRCRFTKVWSQKQWDNHMLKIHGFKNEATLF